MTIAASTRPGAGDGASTSRAADVLVVFGITGDLAKVMTLRSLYRLEARGLLSCPIVGVAVDDWTVGRPARARARGDRRRPARRSTRRSSTASRPGCPTWRATSPTRRRSSASPRVLKDAPQPGLLPRDPAVPVRHGRQGPGRRGTDRERPRRRREAVRPRPRVRPRARRRDARAPRRAPALPDRPLPREDGPRRRSSTCASRTRCSSRSGTATTSRASRSRWPRASASRTAGTSTTRSARCATSSSTT